MTKAPIRTIRPVVVPAQFLLWGPIICGFGALFPGFFAFVISNIVSPSFQPRLGFGIATYLLFFVLFLVLFGMKTFSAPNRTIYAIYPDRIEMEEGLFNRSRRTVLLDRIIDVQLMEGLLQQGQGAGTIRLVTQQLVGQGQAGLTNQVFQLSNVPEPGEVYNLIRSLALGTPLPKAEVPE